MEMLSYFLLGLLGSFALPISIDAQDQTGFISLDCGLPEDSSYSEPITGINYISDAPYIETGVSMRVLPAFQSGNLQQVWNVRSFPEGDKNCYNLLLQKGDRYLIRAVFLYGNYDKKNETPGFDLYLGPNLWNTVALQDESTSMDYEIIHTLQSNHLYICLVNTRNGTPFISALELRLLKNTTYKSQTGSIELFRRYDVGSTTGVTFRFNKDVYDRFWVPYKRRDWTKISTELSINSGNNEYQPPSLAMMTAGMPAGASNTLDFYLDTPNSNDKFYVYLHFAEVEANRSRVMSISHNGVLKYGPFTPQYLRPTTVFTQIAWEGGQYALFSIYRAGSSTLPPILNAFEIYKEKQFPKLQTAQRDVDAILNIKSIYGLKRNWQGDPCAPEAYLWEGLDCKQNDNDPPRIISLNLSSIGLTGEIPSCIANLTELQYLDLSNNSLTGSVPEFLSQLLSLTVLNLEANMLNGPVPAKLIKRSENGLQLRVDGNPNLCASMSCKKKWSKNVVILVVSASLILALIIIALALIWRLKRRKPLDGRSLNAENENNSGIISKSENPHFSYSEVLKITNNFERILGEGGFGTVYHGKLDNDTQVAVKMLSPSSAQGYKEFLTEVKLLTKVYHANLTTLVGYCKEGSDHIGLIYEYMGNGNLKEHLSVRYGRILSWEERIRIVIDAAKGLEYLHNGCKPAIVHRDVKSTNILLNEKFQAKIGDFGMSRVFPTEGGTHVSTVVAGTFGYLDPEYHNTGRLNEKSDVYGFGVVLLEVVTSRPAVDKSQDNQEYYTHICQWVTSMLAEGDVRRIVDPSLEGEYDMNSAWKVVELALACASQSANKRPIMSEVVMELMQCLGKEVARKGKGPAKVPTAIITVNLGIESTPQAR